MTGRYAFFTAMLRFVAAQPARGEAGTAALMARLENAAMAIDEDGVFTAAAADLAPTARAFAGFAALLQKRILPEAVAHGHSEAEARIRWSIDAAMEVVTLLLREAAGGGGLPVTVRLPPLPAEQS